MKLQLRFLSQSKWSKPSQKWLRRRSLLRLRRPLQLKTATLRSSLKPRQRKRRSMRPPRRLSLKPKPKPPHLLRKNKLIRRPMKIRHLRTLRPQPLKLRTRLTRRSITKVVRAKTTLRWKLLRKRWPKMTWPRPTTRLAKRTTMPTIKMRRITLLLMKRKRQSQSITRRWSMRLKAMKTLKNRKSKPKPSKKTSPKRMAKWPKPQLTTARPEHTSKTSL